MKKLLTLALALLLVLGLCAPAMAFTSDSEADDDSVPYELKIYLVEYDDNDFFGIASLPKSDRGYAKNEIVAAVVELYVPEDEAILPGEYGTLVFGGDNVDLDVTDNSFPLDCTSNLNGAGDPGLVTTAWDDNADRHEIVLTITHLNGEENYKWLFFAKVTDDDASLYAELKDGTFMDIDLEASIQEARPEGIWYTAQQIALDGIWYRIQKIVDTNGDIRYIVIAFDAESHYLGYSFTIDADEDHVSEGMALFTSEGSAVLGVNTDGELGVADPAHPAILETSGDLYDDAMDFYNDVVVDVFGLDYMLIGNYVRDSFFEDLVSPKTLIATVYIAPWTAYVTVPDNIVVDPPKTGDAASIMGFVMVALSGAGVVALKKRG